MHQRQNFGVSVKLPIVPGESGTAEFKFSPYGSGHCADVSVACFDIGGCGISRRQCEGSLLLLRRVQRENRFVLCGALHHDAAAAT